MASRAEPGLIQEDLERPAPGGAGVLLLTGEGRAGTSMMEDSREPVERRDMEATSDFLPKLKLSQCETRTFQGRAEAGVALPRLLECPDLSGGEGMDRLLSGPREAQGYSLPSVSLALSLGQWLLLPGDIFLLSLGFVQKEEVTGTLERPDFQPVVLLSSRERDLRQSEGAILSPTQPCLGHQDIHLSDPCRLPSFAWEAQGSWFLST